MSAFATLQALHGIQRHISPFRELPLIHILAQPEFA
jgi:hypothetical protein